MIRNDTAVVREEKIVSQRWLNYMYPLEVQNPIFTLTRNIKPSQLLTENDSGYLDFLVEEEYALKAEIARYSEMER